MHEFVEEFWYLGRNVDVVKTKSNSNNPEQKTKNAHLTEFSEELNAVDKVKLKNLHKSQPQRSKQS